MEQLKISILKKDGDFYYRVRKNNKWVTLARFVRNSKIHKHEINHKCDSFVNELNRVFEKWQMGYCIDYYYEAWKTLTDKESYLLDEYIEDQLIAIEEQFVQMHEKQKKQILQDFEQNFDRMLQHSKERFEDYKKTIAERRQN
jgi:hypothetical protein